ncbi:MAG: OadG family protein [Pseudomonadales bacterium]|nr:OadG family protein [Pseudomonadales bacterium]
MNALMTQGLELMLIGMGVVFVFLVLLVGVTTLMSALVQRFGHQPVEPEPPASASIPATAAPSPAVIKAIEQAVRLHRQSSQS